MAALPLYVGKPWREPPWIERTQTILRSFRERVGRDLVPPQATPEIDSEALFLAPFVVVSHGTQADPILNYANLPALELWDTDLPSLLAMPSRLTAEPVDREERARMLALAHRQGYIDNYAGVRISSKGRRFRIDRAIVWDLTDPDGTPAGQAATFSEWTYLDS